VAGTRIACGDTSVNGVLAKQAVLLPGVMLSVRPEAIDTASDTYPGSQSGATAVTRRSLEIAVLSAPHDVLRGNFPWKCLILRTLNDSSEEPVFFTLEVQ